MLSSGFSNWLNIKPGLQPAGGHARPAARLVGVDGDFGQPVFLELGYLDIRREDRKVDARKLVEIASTIEPVQDGRIYIELVNAPFLKAGGSAAEYRAGIDRALAKGCLIRHESGTYVKFTEAAAALLA
jgi:hypothetical protein